MSNAGFCSAVGDWKGAAEVYDGAGRFVGNGVDQRYVRTEVDENRVKITLSFSGPFKFAGHYIIHDKGTHRMYEGPVNYGFAEAVSENLVQADNYWPTIGMSQKFFLMMTPGSNRQLSLAMLTRGERLCYVVVGENQRESTCATDDSQGPIPGFIDGTAMDLASDPTAGRGEMLLHRKGRWHGLLFGTDGELKPTGEAVYEEVNELVDGGMNVRIKGGVALPDARTVQLKTDGFAAYTTPPTGNELTTLGSLSLFGGRAQAGEMHVIEKGLRVWTREVVSHDGQFKAVVRNWYQGGVRVGSEHGLLRFEGA